MATKRPKQYEYRSLGNKTVSSEEGFQPCGFFWIRIIVLDPAEKDTDDLHCRIEHIELSKWPDYEAISYVWGEPVFSKLLHCEDTVVRITPTLDLALRRFRHKKETKRLWADAVCINQKDRKELSQQVQHMSLIYTSAQSVLVWLGDGPEMDKVVNFLWGLSSSRHESSVTTDRADSSIKEELKRFFGDTRFDAVQRFFALPWFKRRWVVQEAAHGAHFYCGSIDISSHAFHHAVFVLNKSSFPFDRSVLDHISSLESLSERVEEQSLDDHEDNKGRLGHGILDLMVRFSNPVSTDPRDRIYAYLGLAADVRSPYANVSRPEDRRLLSYPRFDGMSVDLRRSMDARKHSSRVLERIWIQVDYEATVSQVYADFAEQMLQLKPNLDILHCAGAFRRSLDSSSNSNLQRTWAPDWRLPMRYSPLLSVPWFNAGGTDVKEEPFLNHPWCSVKGFNFDSIAVACKIPGLDTAHARDTRVMPPVAKFCTALNMRGRYLTGERVWQVLGLTFIADHALNYGIRKCYMSAKDVFGVTGKRVKRNASERDMHTLLDWWTETPESGLSRTDSGGSLGKKARPPSQVEIRKHLKSLHRTESIGSFMKPGSTAGEWGPTSYEQQSHWHSRTPDEEERYFMAYMMRIAKPGPKPKHKENRRSLTHIKQPPRDSSHETLEMGSPDDKDEEMIGQGPDDEPYDCEWRLSKYGWVCFEPHARNLERYAELAHNTLRGRSLFVTSRGYIGIGPDDIQPDDTVAILYGARTPFVLRKSSQQGGHWKLAGDCYIHGIMNGEALDMDLGPDRQFILT
ncbi:Heterokaryon incompatibility protein (HET) domain containing protein [Naviculisporaceae sp. PSN 640]